MENSIDRKLELDGPLARRHAARGEAPLFARWARRLLLDRLTHLETGGLVLEDLGERHVFGASRAGVPSAVVTINDPRCYADIAFGGSVGAGEAYAQGLWDCDDLTAAMRVLLLNRNVLDALDGGPAWLATPMARLAHWCNRNTRAGSRRNIAAHYDLGNEFFALWLDRTMMYSAAVYERPAMSLDEAAEAKLERICRKLDLDATDRVLEIGTGWGGFAVHAASRHGCAVTTVTISREQYQFACQRVAAAGLADRVRVLLADYRDLDPDVLGRFDKLVSIEMIEAVGHEYVPEYFRRCASLLEDDGLMLLQAITIADQHYDRARRSVDFIKRHIFPGSCLTSITCMSAALTRATDLRIFDIDEIGPHYATTLRHWRERFLSQRDAVRELGYSQEFVRLWEFYFCYCEAGFLERSIGDVQMLLVKPGCRRSPL